MGAAAALGVGVGVRRARVSAAKGEPCAVVARFVLCEALECPRLEHPYPSKALEPENVAKVARNGARVVPTRAGV